MASEKITNIVEEVKTLSVLELKELVDAIQEEFGVTAMMSVAPSTDTGTKEDAKTEFDVVLTSFGDAKMAVIKVAKEVLGLGLKEAKAKVEEAPVTIKEGVSEAEANEVKEKFEAAGASIEIK
ncbi:MAG: 50S ribosomal protein L7/L12 [Ruminococcus sp.]|nr:50S ribosomal protein L7/L12 [Ruminococcus sp.]